ncbi:MAG: hypothetical protein LBL58_17045, partial [Tannerellaceae bacterium]|nr:hypothetical protein [Tannerellaceae bacterium]
MLQHFREKTFLLILLFVAGAGGCKNDSTEEKEDEKPDYPDYKVYFNKLDQQQAFETIAGTWQIFSES